MSVTLTTVDLDRLNRRYQALQLRLAALTGQSRELNSQRTRLTKAISLAKARIELGPLASETFEYLQEKAHSRAVGEFEELLSAFVADVIPEAGSIHLELGTERGAPSLDIQLDNKGNIEGILDGNGGGLTNVVVTGLVYAAQARTNTRPLVVLDEPDCWMKATRIQAFTKVIAEVANPRLLPDGTTSLGCQTLMISHNDVSLVDDGAHVLELRAAKPGFPEVVSLSGAKPWDDEAQVGVRWIEVENLRAHAKTRIDLCPGLNVLAGDVNLGKSTMFTTALRALSYGETDDTMLRHDSEDMPTPAMAVRVGLENQVVLEVVRSRKGSPKVLFRRYEAGVLLNEGRQENRGGVPGFITDALKIERVDGLDIQLRSQKQPIFLLNETAARRAQLLSVGRESGLLQDLIERHRLEQRRDKDQSKRDEIELNLVNRTLTVLAPVASLSALVDILNSLFEDARRAVENLKATRDMVARLTPLVGRAKLHDLHGKSLSREPTPPACIDTKPLAALVARLTPLVDRAKLHDLCGKDLFREPPLPACIDTKPLAALVARLAHTRPMASLPAMPESPKPPVVSDSALLTSLLARLRRGAQSALVLQSLVAAPVVPTPADTTALRRTGVNLTKQLEALRAMEKEEKDIMAQEKEAQDALHALKHELGVCPVCSHEFTETENV